MKIVVIGLNAAGANFITRMRRLNENAEIIVYEKSGYVSSSTCSLPYFISDEIDDVSYLNVQSKESLEDRFNVSIHVHHEVTRINRKKKCIEGIDLVSNKSFICFYDKLIIATGSSAIVPPIEGVKNKGIYTLRSVDDAVKIKSFIEEHQIKNAVVVGGGYIGLEMVENLTMANIKVDLVEKSSQLLNNIDEELSYLINDELIKNKVNLHLGKGVNAFKPLKEGIEVYLDDGSAIATQLVILALGVRPNSKLARECGLNVDNKGYIKVDSKLKTNDKDIYALGDVISVKEMISKEQKGVSLASLVSKQSRVLANVLGGIDDSYKETLTTSIVKVYSKTVATTGINEKEAKRLNFDYEKIIITSLSNLAHFSGEMMMIKVLYNRTNYQLLGASIVGGKGADKRIDLLAMAISNKTKIYKLKDLSLSYAPTYSSSKDPINIIGMIGDNLKNNLFKQFSLEDIDGLDKKNVTFLDVRDNSEYTRGHIEGFFLNIPLNELRHNLDKIDKNKPVYVSCHSGLRSYNACRILKQNGFDCYNLIGGYYLYKLKKEYQH